MAHGLGRGGGYEPLPEAGEYVCDCYEHGTGEPWAHVGSNHVHEQVVRCRDCARATWGETFGGIRTLVCRRFQSFNHETTPDGFCAWGDRRAE